MSEVIRTLRKCQPPILREAGDIVDISSCCLCCCQDFELSLSAANSLHVSQCIADAGLSSEVLAHSVVCVDLDQSHCAIFDFNDLKVSHRSFPCSLFALRSTEGILPSSAECAIHNHTNRKDFWKVAKPHWQHGGRVRLGSQLTFCPSASILCPHGPIAPNRP